jgi:signal transduction histidine kinase
VEVRYSGEPIGEIAVAKAAGERMSADEDVLLAAMVGQAGLAFNNARLAIELEARLHELSMQADELQASRQRIVTAREGQRQRVVQIIHDLVEVRLETARGTIEGIADLLPGRADEAAERVETVLVECGAALDDLRTLARGIFPAVLADQGLLAAVHTHVMQAQLPIGIEIDGEGARHRFSPDAEANVYFCVVQALANAGAYAPSSSVVVRLAEEDSRLAFSVADDGPGVDQRRLLTGADIRDMRDRLEALGGSLEARSSVGRGTVISGWVPLAGVGPALVAVSVGVPAAVS